MITFNTRSDAGTSHGNVARIRKRGEAVKIGLLQLLAAIGFAAGIEAQPRPVTRQVGSVTGTVVDSVSARVLGGATVQLIREGGAEGGVQTVESDALGRFRFTNVRPGRYLLGFLHPVLDALGVDPAPRNVVVLEAITQRVDLAIPSARTLRTALCGDTSVRDSIALVIGYARRARDRAPLDSTIVTVQWRPRARSGGPVPQGALQRRVAASGTGFFVVCGAQPGDTIQLGAARKGALASSESLVIPAAGLLSHDPLLNDAPELPGAAAAVARDSNARGPQAGGAIAVSGVIIAADGRQPIAGAIVGIRDGAATRSDVLGAWRLGTVAAGAQTLLVRAVGYAPLSMTIAVTPQMSPLQLAMERMQGPLDTVNVVADAAADRNLANFLERKRTRGSGTFLTEEDITSRRAVLTSDLFASVQGGITIERDTLGNKFITLRSNTFRSNRCLPAIFLDGMSMRRLTTADIDGLVRPDELFGIEVYRAANAPVEFSEQDGCGTILFWTKRE